MSSAFFVNPPPDWLNVHVNSMLTSVSRFQTKTLSRIIGGEASSTSEVYRSMFGAGHVAYNCPDVEVVGNQLSIGPSQFANPGDTLSINSQWAYSVNSTQTIQFRLTINGLNIVSDVLVPTETPQGEVYLKASITVGEVGQPLVVSGSTHSILANGWLPETTFNDPSLGVTPITIDVAANKVLPGSYRHVLTQVSVVRS